MGARSGRSLRLKPLVGSGRAGIVAKVAGIGGVRFLAVGASNRDQLSTPASLRHDPSRSGVRPYRYGYYRYDHEIAEAG